MNSEYTDLRVQPPLSDWADYLQLSSFDNGRLTELRNSARTRLVQSAEQFVLRLHGIADDADIPANTAGLLTGVPENQPLVMTGHQPAIFHSGLTFKYETTQQFAADNNAIGVAVVIDTDVGDAGQFSYPQLSPSQNDAPTTALAIDTVATSTTLYGHSRLRDVSELKQLGQHLNDQLRSQSLDAAADGTTMVFTAYANLAAVRATAMEANLITRWQNGVGSRLLELPLSAIASFPEVLTLTADILKQPIRFAKAYNSALDVFRDEHNIRNTANPFPNLKVEDDTCELPFWLISHNKQKRHVLEAELNGNETKLLANGGTVDTFTGNITAEALEPMLLQNIQIVPRGALITAFLRLLFSDLFVHGTGGGRYDRFTDEFIRSWWNVEPPPFTIASASRFLFTDQRKVLHRLDGIKESLRELQFNPQRQFGTGVFSDALESQLQKLLQQKQAAIDQMQSVHDRGDSAKEIGKQIQQFTNEIKEAVTAEFEPQLQQLAAFTPEHRDAINCRTYPFFFAG